MKTQYIKILSENGNELLFDKNCNLISEIEKSTNMKTPMTAVEWFDKNYITSTINVVKLMESYSNYLLNFHLEQFAEECKENIELYGDEGADFTGIYIDKKSIDQTLT